MQSCQGRHQVDRGCRHPRPGHWKFPPQCAFTPSKHTPDLLRGVHTICSWRSWLFGNAVDQSQHWVTSRLREHHVSGTWIHCGKGWPARHVCKLTPLSISPHRVFTLYRQTPKSWASRVWSGQLHWSTSKPFWRLSSSHLNSLQNMSSQA